MGARVVFTTPCGGGLGTGDVTGGFTIVHPALPRTLSANTISVNVSALPNRTRGMDRGNSPTVANPRRIGWCNSNDLINVGTLPRPMR